MQQETTDLKSFKYDEAGLIPAVVQDAQTDRILMLAYMSRESLTRTLETGQTWFWSRSRGRLWHKGEESGAVQRVKEILVDCDLDALVVRVHSAGPACHTGQTSCFFRLLKEGEGGTLSLVRETEILEDEPAKRLMRTILAVSRVVAKRRRERPKGSYTTYLFERGLDKILKKIGEECAEIIIASKNAYRDPLVAEMSDLIYHLLVLAEHQGIGADHLASELENRRK